MKRYLAVFLGIVFLSAVAGCGKKETATEEMQEPMSMEAISSINATAQPQPKAAEATKSAVTKAEVTKVESVQPSVAQAQALPATGVSTKPSGNEIQTALKNAGYYSGTIDGKIGHLTKKAIAAFQAANNLKADGKVGPKTWAALSVYLDAAASQNLPAKPAKQIKR